MKKLSNEAVGIIEFMQTSQILTLKHNKKDLSLTQIEKIGNDLAMGAMGVYDEGGIELLRYVKEQYIIKQSNDCKKMGWKFITPEYKYEEFSDCTITTLSF